MTTIQTLFKQFSLLDAIRFSLLELARKLLCNDSYYAYSQTGEDIIINSILKNIPIGFYIEVGCNEAIQHSNTFKLYRRGWRGITVDASKKMVDMHRSLRKNDIQVCAAVSNEIKEVVFYEFAMDEISTIDNDFYVKNVQSQSIKNKSMVVTRTLDSIVSETLPPGFSIDLLSIDVEGHDYPVLSSIDLHKYRPKLIVIEMHNFDLSNPEVNDIYSRLVAHDYVFAGYVVWNGYFLAKEFSSTL
ncbi:FkbM family methyltransferase [Fibrella aquatilis]|uniref:FkbM family methyltransferase n=1 Tax=Fibrella aquatilis TaxID=2817059 RepID=A0A939JZ18_9BACT|nr:FkbM family methyltransferase [Fibrella aquatilis]MBO0930953.1 FkbM family methyltransferase [Fibrella aquatilis]